MSRFPGWGKSAPAAKSEASQPRRQNRTEEHQIQTAVIALLRVRGWLAIRYNSLGYAIDGRYIRGYIVAGLNVSSGHPDVVGFKEGRCLMLEIKKPGGVLSPSQERFHRFARRHGCHVFTVESAAEVDGIIRGMEGET